LKAYTTLLDDLMPELPGAETALVLHHIKRTCNDFYERSLYSQEVLVPMSVVAGTATYNIVSADPSNFECGKVLDVKLVDSTNSIAPLKLSPRTPAQLNTEMPDWESQTGTPKFYTQRAIDQITLAYVPADSYASSLYVTMAKLPLYAGGGIDDFVYEKFAEALAAGVKGRLMRMSKKPWTDKVQAREYMAEFDREVAAAAVIVGKAYGRGKMRSRAYG
jgi:hypothetical protein